MFYVAGEKISITVSLSCDSVNGLDFFPALPGTFTYTLKDHQGVDIVGFVDVNVDTDTQPTEVLIVLPPSVNSKTLQLERRILECQWQSLDNQLYSKKITYYLTDPIVIDCSPDDVRATLGVNRSELKDHEISLITSYYAIKQQIGTTVDTSLASGTFDTLRMNRIIVLKECLRLIPSLRLKAAQSQTSGTENFKRFDIDWEALKKELEDQLSGELEPIPDPEVGGLIFFTKAGREDIFG